MQSSSPAIPAGQHRLSATSFPAEKTGIPDGRCTLVPGAGPTCRPDPAQDLQAVPTRCRPLCQRSVARQQAAVDQSREAILAWLGQPLPINYHPDSRSPLEGLVPRPKQPLRRQHLEEDDWLADSCKEPGYLAAFQQLLDERRLVEESGGEFCFKPLMTTLRNMQILIRHIRDGQQFDGPLLADEDQALAWAQDRVAALLLAGAPYKRTVFLAIAVLILCEIVTDRQVLGPLKERQPERAGQFLARVQDWFDPPIDDSQPIVYFSAARLDPLKVAALCWGGNNPGGGSETEQLVGPRSFYGHMALCRLVHARHLLIYPSFQPLDIEHFCRAGHLGLHPVGMITDYALNADGVMQSPLAFAYHDLGHLYSLAPIGEPGDPLDPVAPCLWACPDKRRAFRSLLLDLLPQRLAPLKLDAALRLLLFVWFHEQGPKITAHLLNDEERQAFISGFLSMAAQRRAFCNGLAAEYQAITDTDAALAVAWAQRLYQCWQAADCQPLSAARLDACARDFLAIDAPQLLAAPEFHRAQQGGTCVSCLRPMPAGKPMSREVLRSTGTRPIARISTPACCLNPGIPGVGCTIWTTRM